jgi:hypothetical protein
MGITMNLDCLQVHRKWEMSVDSWHHPCPAIAANPPSVAETKNVHVPPRSGYALAPLGMDNTQTISQHQQQLQTNFQVARKDESGHGSPQ